MVRATVVPLKSICAEQISKLQVRHQHDLELLDDVRTFSKQRAVIEATYAQALLKLVQQHMPKKEQTAAESEASTDKSSAAKSPQKVWRNFVEETERIAKCHQQMADIYSQQVAEPAKILRQSKAQVLKKVVDQLTSVQKEVLAASNELLECHKGYMKEETAAADARQKAEALEDKVKKKSTGLFQSMASLQKKSDKSSSLRDQCDTKSTAARNTYVIQLALVNAQLSRYFEHDLPSLVRQLDSNVTGQIKQFLATICRTELETCSVALRGMTSVQNDVDTLNSQQTMQSFFNDYPVFKDVLQYPFDAVEGDQVDHVSTLHGGDEMIAAETRKWANFLVQESKNINGLKRELINIRRTLINAGRLASPGDGPGTGTDANKSATAIVEECDARLDDLRMAIRRSRTSKIKADAVLNLFKAVGIDVTRHADASCESEEEDEDDETICADIRQLQHQLRVGAVQPNLLATLSPNTSTAGRISGLSVNTGSSTSVSPASSSVASPNISAQKSLPQTQQKPERMTSVPAAVGGSSGTDSAPKTASVTKYEHAELEKTSSSGGQQSFDFQAQIVDDEEEERLQRALQDDTAEPVEKWSSGMRFPLYAVSLYDYQAGNYDELSVFAGDRLEVVGDGDSEGWLMARTQLGQTGFIPLAYVATFQTESELQVYMAEMERENREAAAAAAAQAEEVDIENVQPEIQEPEAEEVPADNFATVPSFELTQASPTTEIADTEVKRLAAQPPPVAAAENGVAQPVSVELYAQAVYDFDGVDDDELSFLEGDVIRVLARDYNGVDDGYWFGELNGGRRGWFPSLVVEVLDSPNGEVALPGELKSPECGPPAFIPPPPVVLIEATPLPTPLDSPTGTHHYKRGKGSNQNQQDEDTDSGFGGTSVVTGAVGGGAAGGEDDEERQDHDDSGDRMPEAPPTKQIDVMALLRKRAAEITELVLTEARQAIEKGEFVVTESFEEDDDFEIGRRTAAPHDDVHPVVESKQAAELVSAVIDSAAIVVSSEPPETFANDAQQSDTKRSRIQSASGVSISSEGAVSYGEDDLHNIMASLAPKAEAEEVSEETRADEEDEMSLR